MEVKNDKNKKKHEILYNNLIEKIALYHPSKDFSRIEKAYLLALEAHEGQVRKSGEDYIIHPLEVATILAELEMDHESIISGILHDVIEDTKFEYLDIVRLFGAEIADIVDGLTKLEKLRYNSKEEAQAENYRKLFLAMAKDIRVIIIKITDRLHNMRTLKFMTPEKQTEIAQETLDIYAPLAHRLGISKVRYELEDLSFRYLEEDAYFELADKIVRKQSERLAYVNRICEELREKLIKNDINGEVHGRPKHFFSIYKKMVNQNKTLDQIYDLFAVRVLVDSISDCYEVLGIVHEMYKPIPGRFKDYIAMAKNNMYQSLHNTLIGPEGEPFEIQIRTFDMHRTAEYGIAAHWKYKQETNEKTKLENEEDKLSWLGQILEWQQDFSDNKEYLQALKGDLNIFSENVYCFTPKGEVISLSKGANPIDFAYNIHTAVGNKTIGARVNGKMVTLTYELQNGDRVEIITSQNSRGPSLDWLKIVKTNQAKSKINQWFKQQNKEDYIINGKNQLEKEAKRKGYDLPKLLTSDGIKIALKRYAFKDLESMYASVGRGGIKDTQIINRLIDEERKDKVKNQTVYDIIDDKNQKKKGKSKGGIVVKGVGDTSEVRLSKCCTPLPGDEIVGYTTRGRGLSIHRTDCVNIISLDEMERQRLVEVWWDLPEDGLEGAKYDAEFLITADDRNNLLVDLSRIFSEDKISVKSLNARISDYGEAFFNVGIEIKSKKQLETIRNKILNLKGVRKVERVTT